MSSHAASLAQPLASRPRVSKSVAVLVLLCAAQFMVAVDVTVVNVALPSIGKSLSVAPADLSWVLIAYTLMAGALLMLGGRAADLLGGRRVLLAGLTIFVAGSLTAGLAESAGQLIAARATQGVGAALLSPGALAVLVATFTGAERTKALAAWGAVAAAGAAVGVVAGGALTTWATWRWAFLINVPVGILAAVLMLRWVPADGARQRRPFDLAGAGVAVAGLLALVYAIEDASRAGWASTQTFGLLALVAAAFAAFLAIERRASYPLVPLRIFRGRSLPAGSAAMFAATALMVGAFFISSLYMQQVLGLDAIETGLGFLPVVVMVGIASHAGSRLVGALGTRLTAVLGLLLAGAGDVLLSGAGAAGSYTADLLPGLLVASAGIGLVFVTAPVTSMDGVEEDGTGLSSGILTTSHELGAAIGVAVLSAIAVSVASGSVAGPQALAAGYSRAYLVAGLGGLVAAAVALFTFPSIRPQGSQSVRVH